MLRPEVVSPQKGLKSPPTEGTGPVRSPLILPPLPRPERPVGGRLSLFTEAWSALTADQWVTSIIDKGYFIPFSIDPPLTLSPSPERPTYCEAKRQILKQEVLDLLSKGAIEEVRTESPGFYSHLFVVTKKNGKYRPIIDLSCLNRFIALDKFKMETTRTIRESILPGEWAVSIDLRDAYLHVPIHPSSRKALRFLFEGRAYQFRVLPFGLSTAPFVFTKLMVTVAAAIRKAGSPVIQYFDDWLLHQLRRSVLMNNLTLAWEIIQNVGLIPNRDKSDLVPSQTCLLYTSPSPRDLSTSRMPSSA